ncbi:MAG: hypothetical protein AAF798_04845 [Bacteroidota bacterium]
MKVTFFALTVFFLVSCQTTKKVEPAPPYLDGILFDPKLDADTFALCDGDEFTIQYFNNSKGLEYEGGKPAIVEAFEKNYVLPKGRTNSGLIRIRFVVNCKGEAGRFRLIGMDEAYQEQAFPKEITDQLLSITKSLKGWQPKVLRGQTRDYYQYLIFKIKNGAIIKILP